MNRNFLKTSIYIGIFLLVSGISHFAFKVIAQPKIVDTSKNQPIATPSPIKKQTGLLVFSGPKTEVCPINGELFTKEEKDIWQKRRPLMVMIENHQDARPQSGLQNADIVYEAVAEGGITRFMGVYYCNVVKESTNKYDLGPVRSARTYFLDLASEYSDFPLYTHVGGANCGKAKDPATGMDVGPCTTDSRAQAIEQISMYGWNNKGTWSDLSQFSLPYKVCRREPERTGAVKDTEHTMYCSSKELWNIAENRGLTNQTEINKISWDKNYKSWSFKQKDESTSIAASGQKITFDFWPGYKEYSVAWEYDKDNNTYLRLNGNQPQIDFNDNQQLTTKSIVIQFVKETRSVDVHLHNLYNLIGKGKGVLIQNGLKTDIEWSKTTRTARTTYKDLKTGKEVAFVPGRVWVEILPLNSVVNYEGL